MGLRFPGGWRFDAPANAPFLNAAIPASAVLNFEAKVHCSAEIFAIQRLGKPAGVYLAETADVFFAPG